MGILRAENGTRPDGDVFACEKRTGVWLPNGEWKGH